MSWHAFPVASPLAVDAVRRRFDPAAPPEPDRAFRPVRGVRQLMAAGQFRAARAVAPAPGVLVPGRSARVGAVRPRAGWPLPSALGMPQGRSSGVAGAELMVQPGHVHDVTSGTTGCTGRPELPSWR